MFTGTKQLTRALLKYNKNNLLYTTKLYPTQTKRMVHYIIDETDPKTSELEAPYIKLYAAQTPNNFKVSILLELLGLDYHVHKFDIGKQETFQDWYVALNPNSKVPSLTDVNADGKATHINESAAVMLYLCDKYDKDRKFSYPPGDDLYYVQLEWLFFQMASLGPMGGQFGHFSRFAPEKIEYAINRYRNEVVRLFKVLEARLEKTKTGFLVADKLNIADVISYPYVAGLSKFGGFEEDVAQLPRLTQWLENLSKIEAFQKGSSIFA